MANLLVFSLLLSLNTWGLYNQIGNKKFNDPWPNQEFIGLYIFPNELQPDVFYNILKDREGILISVGTFRALFDFAIGNFQKLIMYDLDIRIVMFNREHLDDIKNLVKQNEDSELEMEEYYNKYKEYLHKINSNNQYCYWKNKEMWEKITNAIKLNNIYVIQGNLVDKNLSKALKQALMNQNLDNVPVTIDLSNVLQYIIKENIPKLIKSLKKFSFRINKNQDIVLLTQGSPVLSILNAPTLLDSNLYIDHWNYYSSSLLNFLRYLEYYNRGRK